MKKGWKIILIIVLVAVALGGICIGVGSITGADWARIYSVLDNIYNVEMYRQWILEVWATAQTAI